MQIVNTKKRKAISPVLATVILIAITLIAAIAIAGFVFGLFGSFTSTARVSVSVTSCAFGATNEACILSAINTGTANVNAVSCSLTYGGTTYAGTITGAPAAIGATSTAVSLTCTGPTTAAGAGVSVVGSVALSNGGSAPFSGTATS